MSSVMLPIFMPESWQIDKLLRALIGIIFFQSAYMAEVVRGGLQAIPKGQYEAAEALGLSYWKSMFFIILPQALKLVIPGIVNTFIALFKDTTLVLIIGLFDLLAVVQAAFADPTPFTALSSSNPVLSSPSRSLNDLSISFARSTAEVPLYPALRIIAISSESVRFSAPSCISFSLGLSSSFHPVMGMYLPDSLMLQLLSGVSF